MTEASGGCQCGAVRYHAAEFADNPHICHCRMCQKAVGNYFAALISVPRGKLTWTRGSPARFRSSEHVDRGFCANCGTPLFYEDVTGTHVTLTLGSLDNPELFPPKTQDGMQGRVSFFHALPGLPDTGDTGSDDPEWAAAIAASNRQHPDLDTDVSS
ncbi:aldehyde-activating protein [Devosia geojensis]|uniref:Aldehyde-activating protein n=1 Tax=Devosia geojensis TaxID=443610 RepID=A0A0F5FPH1_9HYPH|nr:GFA family protein [Devosia geojensis]KKB10741.1 aldehyde-activating protein [Devosia geojensis]